MSGRPQRSSAGVSEKMACRAGWRGRVLIQAVMAAHLVRRVNERARRKGAISGCDAGEHIMTVAHAYQLPAQANP